MKRFLLLLGLILTMALTACGGGGGSAGTNVQNPGTGAGTGTGTGTTTTSVTVVKDFQLGFNKNFLNNNGADVVTLNVTAIDQNNNVARGQTVTVTVNSDAIFNAPTNVTNADGLFSGSITSPSNKNNRPINVTVKLGDIVKTATLDVIGSAITITPLPAAPLVGENVVYNITLNDSAGTGIPNATLTVSGTAGLASSIRTNGNGNAVVSGIAPTIAGTYTVVVSGSGVTTTRSILVVSPSGSTSIPNATSITTGSLNSNVTNIRPNLSDSTVNRAVVTFRMIDSLNQSIPNIRVRFSIVPPGLGAGEAMSTANTIVVTDSAGTARSDYISGQRSSPTDGVRIRACYARSDAELAGNACPQFVETTITVAGTPLNLSIFSNNVIEPVGVGNILYKKTYVVQVADAAGAPVQGAVVSSSVDITHYGKGVYAGNYTRGALAPTITDNPADGTLNTLDGVTYSVPGTYVVASTTFGVTTTVNLRIWCANEDKSRNGVLDSGENTDGDGVLEPRASDVVVLPVGSNVTDANGNVTLVAQWGQNVGFWLAFTLKATTNVGGSEGTNSASFVTSFLQADEANGAFRVPPYGINACNVNN
jgi:Bacterial Ig-like domain (group 1)